MTASSVTERDRSALPPGPKLPYLLQTLLVWQFTGPFLRYCRRRYGQTFTVRAYPAKAMIYVTDPGDVKAVVAADPDVLHAGEANAILGPVLGRRSILLCDVARLAVKPFSLAGYTCQRESRSRWNQA